MLSYPSACSYLPQVASSCSLKPEHHPENCHPTQNRNDLRIGLRVPDFTSTMIESMSVTEASAKLKMRVAVEGCVSTHPLQLFSTMLMLAHRVMGRFTPSTPLLKSPARKKAGMVLIF